MLTLVLYLMFLYFIMWITEFEIVHKINSCIVDYCCYIYFVIQLTFINVVDSMCYILDIDGDIQR